MINENCIFTMHVISLKDIKAKDIFKNIENKLKNNIKITDDDIASLQLIIYTSYDEPRVKILNKTFNLIQKIADKTNMDINELSAITYLLDGLCANMLSEEEQKEYVGGSKMIFNPRERYHYNEGKYEGRKEGIKEGMKKVAKNLILEDMPIKKIMKVTGLTKEEILN